MDIDQPSSESLNPIVGGSSLNAGQAENASHRLRPLSEEPSDEQLFQNFCDSENTIAYETLVAR